MRGSLWLQFHAWTLGLVALVSVLNFSSLLRPFSSKTNRVEIRSPILMVESAKPSSKSEPKSTWSREPASPENPRDTEAENLASTALAAPKLATIGCDSDLVLKLSRSVKQVRLKFENCFQNEVLEVMNMSNGFQATVFSPGNSLSMAPIVDEPSVPGVFITPEIKSPNRSKTTAKTELKNEPSRHPTSTHKEEPVSTDYISLNEGINEIHIKRTGSEQKITVVRK